MESEKRIKFEEGKMYFFMCYALVCGGKSTFFEQILSQTSKEENKNKYNVNFVSSDEIRADLSHKMQKENPEMTFKQCFDKTGKQTAKVFDKEIHKCDWSSDVCSSDLGIDRFLNLFCKDKSSQFFIVFIPKIKKPLEIDNLHFPFSLNYFIQCYLRLNNRHGHEVLNGEDEQSKLVYISFLKLFQNFDFHKKISSEQNFSSNVFIQDIDFTDESKDLEIDIETENFFKNVIKKMRAFDMDNIKKEYENEINNYFKGLEEKYEGKNVFEDTRGIIENEVSDILLNGI